MRQQFFSGKTDETHNELKMTNKCKRNGKIRFLQHAKTGLYANLKAGSHHDIAIFIRLHGQDNQKVNNSMGHGEATPADS